MPREARVLAVFGELPRGAADPAATVEEDNGRAGVGGFPVSRLGHVDLQIAAVDFLVDVGLTDRLGGG